MAAYVVIDLDVVDIAEYLQYQKAIWPLLDKVGARYLARGGDVEVLEGDYHPHRVVLMEFPSPQVLQAFFESEVYQALEGQRRACSSARIISVEGLNQARKA